MAQIRKRAPLQYQARVRLQGHPEASRTFTSKADAVAWATSIEQITKQGLGECFREASKLSLHDALLRYLLEVTPSKKSAAHETALIKRWLKNPMAALPIVKIRGADLALYRDHRMQAGISGNTLRIEFALIGHLYEVARKDWGLETLTNPVKAFRKPKVSRGRDRRLEDGEEDLLLQYCITVGNLRLHSIIILAVETAMRRSELVGVRWVAVNLKTRMIYIHDTKNGTARTVPLSSRAVAAIMALPHLESPFMLNMHCDTLTYDFVQACKACGIEGLRFHDLRHEATSRLFEKGFNMMEVSTITGHKTLSMLKRYTHLKPSDLLTRLG